MPTAAETVIVLIHAEINVVSITIEITWKDMHKDSVGGILKSTSGTQWLQTNYANIDCKVVANLPGSFKDVSNTCRGLFGTIKDNWHIHCYHCASFHPLPYSISKEKNSRIECTPTHQIHTWDIEKGLHPSQIEAIM